MEHLWSPWRSKYIATFKDPPKNEETSCFLCNAANCSDFNNDNLVVFKSSLSVILLNRYPYNSGHLLITPKRHIGKMPELTTDEIIDLSLLVKKTVTILENLYKPHGFNIGVNLGRAAGAGVPSHIHYHVVPRWNGDTNFVTVLGDFKVISEAIEEARAKIEIEFLNYGNKL